MAVGRSRRASFGLFRKGQCLIQTFCCIRKQGTSSRGVELVVAKKKSGRRGSKKRRGPGPFTAFFSPLFLPLALMSEEITIEFASPLGPDLVDFESRNTKAFKCPLCSGAVLPPRIAILTEVQVQNTRWPSATTLSTPF